MPLILYIERSDWMKFKKLRKLILLIGFGLLVAVLSKYGLTYVQYDIHSFSTKAIEATSDHNELYKEINKKADDYYVAPKNAHIDKVWKKTPGLTGRKVNVLKSYQKMKKKDTFDKEKLVYDRIPPKVTLEDLPAAPIYRGHPNKQAVSFLINVSWGEEHIPDMLKTLEKHNVQATFFIEGKWARKHKDYAKMIAEKGHTIGNHAFDHPDMANLSQESAKKQIRQTNDILESLTDQKPKWFAPPSGSFNHETVKIAAAENMETILWTVDTIDWKKPSTTVMNQRVKEKLHPGATILMHPTPVVKKGLDEMIRNVKKQHLSIVTIDTLLQEE